MYDEVKLKENVMAGRRLGTIATYFVLAVLVLPLFISTNKTSAAGVPTFMRPSGMIVYDSQGRYYYTIYTPGTNYADPRLRYIGQAEVLDYYQQRGRKAYLISDAEKANYTIHDHNLALPCGEPVRDRDGRIAFLEPLGWPTGQEDQHAPNFSYSENFPYYVPRISNYTQGSDAHYLGILEKAKVNQLSFPIVPINSIYPTGIPNCAIVKQVGSLDYYRVARHVSMFGYVATKVKFFTPELLGLWIGYNTYAYEADLSGLYEYSGATVTLPPGILLRTTEDPTVYFIDDEGYKVVIPTQQKFDELGFSPLDVMYVSQSTLDASKTRVFDTR